jgi:hypothetical protein
MSHNVYKDKETGEFVPESTYNRSVAQGGDRYEVIEVPDVGDNVDQIFGSIQDFYDLADSDYDEDDMVDLFFDGGGDYGEE